MYDVGYTSADGTDRKYKLESSDPFEQAVNVHLFSISPGGACCCFRKR